MIIKKRWVAYCSGNTRDATEDDWNNFALDIFLHWQQRQLKLDVTASNKKGKALTEYAVEHYSFTHFVNDADIYQELLELEQNRHIS